MKEARQWVPNRTYIQCREQTGVAFSQGLLAHSSLERSLPRSGHFWRIVTWTELLEEGSLDDGVGHAIAQNGTGCFYPSICVVHET